MGAIFLFILDEEFREGNVCSSKLCMQGDPTHLISSLQSRRAALNPELTPTMALASKALDNCHHKTCGQEQIFCHLIVCFTPATSAK